MKINRSAFVISASIVVVAVLLSLIVINYTKEGDSAEISKQQSCLQNLVNIADSLRGSVPDSALVNYNKIIEMLPNPEGNKVNLNILAKSYNGIAYVYLVKGEIALALENDSIAMDFAIKSDVKQTQAEVFIIKGLLLNHLSDYTQSLQCYEKAEAYLDEKTDYKNLARIHSSRAMIYFDLGEIPKVIEGFTKSLLLGKQFGDESLMADNYMNLAVVYSNQSQNDSVLNYYNRALVLFKKTNDKDGELRCYNNIGNAYYGYSDFPMAIEYYRLSMDLALEMDDKPNLAKAYNNLGDVYIQIGDYETASGFLFESLKIKEQINNKGSLAKGYFGLGKLFFYKKDYQKSMQYFQKSLTINREINNVIQISSCLNSIASIYSVESKRDSAIIYYKEVIKSYQELDYPFGISNSCINLADEYRMLKRYNESEQLLLRALQLKTEMKEEDGIATVYYNLADLYLDKSLESVENQMKWIKKAEEKGLLSFAIASRLGMLPLKRDVSKSLREIYQKQGRYQKALEYSELYNTLSDSVLNKANTEALTFAEARWNAEKKQKEIDSLKETALLDQAIIEQKKIESKHQKIIIGFVVVLLVLTIIFVVVFILYMRKRNAMRYQEQLTRMTALRMQNARNAMSPHFFFNILGTISGVSTNQENLKAKLNSLSLLLRKVIENIDRLAVPLNEEITTVKAFIDLSSDQIQEPFEVKYLIEEQANLNQLIPAMLVQIPVENAIKHGLRPLEGEKKLVIDISDCDGYLKIAVIDNGIGLTAARSRVSTGTGTGLKVLMQTINLLNIGNQKKIKFSVKENQPNQQHQSGTSVEILVPHDFNYTLLTYEHSKN